MSGNVGIEVLGLKEALKELNRIDPKLRREITRDFKQIVKPVITRAEALLPSGAPLSGMARSWKGKSGADIMSWMDTRVKKNLKPLPVASKFVTPLLATAKTLACLVCVGLGLKPQSLTWQQKGNCLKT